MSYVIIVLLVTIIGLQLVSICKPVYTTINKLERMDTKYCWNPLLRINENNDVLVEKNTFYTKQGIIANKNSIGSEV